MEGIIVIEDCENKVAEINIINYKSIKKYDEKGFIIIFVLVQYMYI